MSQHSDTVIRVLAILALFTSVGELSLAAQEAPRSAPNSIYVELLGNGVLYSINYDRRVAEQVSGRIGLMVIAGGGDDAEEGSHAVVAPLMANYLLGAGSHRLETGIGVAIVDGRLDSSADDFDESFRGVMGTAMAGYRYQPIGGGLLFRVGLTPFFGRGGIIPWFGASVGYAF